MTDSSSIYVDLLRHGEPEGGKRYRGITDDPLSTLGWQQMWAAADRHQQWEKIISSPLSRCRDFSLALAEKRQLPTFENTGLREIHFGDWEGRSPTQLWQTDKTQYGDFLQDPLSNPPPAGESLQHFSQRVTQAWQQIVDELDTTHTVLIIHGGTIRAILHHLLCIPLSSIMKIEVPFACITRLEIIRDFDGSSYTRLISHGA
jgi:alpha-ribazole phosphatase/probable phosphoglycerate mutase